MSCRRVSWFCSLKGNEFFAEVEEDFIQDDFNLTGLSAQVPHYEFALDTILDVESPATAGFSEEQQVSPRRPHAARAAAHVSRQPHAPATPACAPAPATRTRTRTRTRTLARTRPRRNRSSRRRSCCTASSTRVSSSRRAA